MRGFAEYHQGTAIAGFAGDIGLTLAP